MKPAARNFILSIPAVVWLAVCVVATTSALRAATPPPAPPPPTTAPAPAPTSSPVRDLLAYGTDQRFWSADIIPVVQAKTPSAKTFLRVLRARDSQWRILGELEAPAISLANRGTELLVVLDGGDWKIVSETGARSGNA